ncbi:MAG: DNRLRE domain-containing protein [Verrucomicrobiota bacterium]
MSNDPSRIDKAVEGLLPEDEWHRLQAEILEDEQLRKSYVERAWLHGQLCANADHLPELLETSESAPQSPAKWGIRSWAMAAAVTIGLLGWFLSLRSEKDPMVAVLVEADGCRWAGSELPTTEGAGLKSGKLALVEGMATIAFESGATVTMEAPTTLEILSKMRCRLLEGSVVADVPESAHGFTIDTSDLEVIDLGTKFGVTASAFGDSHVIVFEGAVEVERPDQEVTLLKEGKSLHHGSNPPLPNQEIAREPVQIEADGDWLAIPTSVGRGKDSFVRRTHRKPFGAHALLMVKHTELAEGNERRTFLTFDLENVSKPISEAELVLDVEASGLGFSALIPDSRFAVYGITDGDLDSWKEEYLTWENAPVKTEDFADDGQKVQKLAQFTIRRGAAPHLVSIASADLTRFLQRDQNRLASLVIIRETGENDRQGLVHAFASKEHPTARPPTLRLKTP